MYFRSTIFLRGDIECRSTSAVLVSFDEHSNFSNSQNNIARRTVRSVEHLEMLHPIASPFPDAERSKSHTSLFATPPKAPTVSHLQRKSERRFKKTKGVLGAKEMKYDFAAYLREDEDAFSMDKSGSPTSEDHNGRTEPTSRQLIKNRIILKKSCRKF